jgi:hypothetical protein
VAVASVWWRRPRGADPASLGLDVGAPWPDLRRATVGRCFAEAATPGGGSVARRGQLGATPDNEWPALSMDDASLQHPAHHSGRNNVLVAWFGPRCCTVVVRWLLARGERYGAAVAFASLRVWRTTRFWLSTIATTWMDRGGCVGSSRSLCRHGASLGSRDDDSVMKL